MVLCNPTVPPRATKNELRAILGKLLRQHTMNNYPVLRNDVSYFLGVFTSCRNHLVEFSVAVCHFHNNIAGFSCLLKECQYAHFNIDRCDFKEKQF